ncbi:peptidoglycan DD-metalloendopeptidase family protein [Streptomyces sp. OfavH-34-F]|uniref:peptidoglycan DD-metalloendopeptidase family protein n=1 Tax=Streptomyces sp. OfavH-34-F TaxID=2917760 RepID=UPI001EF2336E|nr:peptidoglycan DD-metalloendopeptidase family protein [Streptomyces sp. OfavH-34-F]MCG7524558.1 peptidoglycan DD-metalloendopeptidase family protein [Streptomyces sp. OfavH-34-F]
MACLLGSFLLLPVIVFGGGSPPEEAVSGELNTDAVPALYLPWVLKAGAMCDEIPAALIAAQIEQESGWDPEAVSPVGAQGISQFMPGTWPSWGRDDDGNGKADPYDPGDAIMAQGRYDCAHADLMAGYLKEGRVHGELIELVLAAYNAGAGGVLDARGVPDNGETRQYVDLIMALVAKYTKALKESGAVPAGQRLASPLRVKALITSPYGVKRPSSAYGYHTGTDFGVGVGTEVHAAGAGTVTFAGWNSAYGNRIVIRHPKQGGKTVETTYNHLFSLGVAKGDTVSVGQVIGATGNTGNSTGPHLHFEVKYDGDFTDPAPWIGLE